MGGGTTFNLDPFNDNRAMQTQAHRTWWPKIATFSLAALAAGSAAYWVMKWVAIAPAGSIAPVVFAEPVQSDPQVVARLLGGGQASAGTTPVDAGPAPDNATNRFKLMGVVADRTHSGHALISVDGQPAKPYRVGAQVNENLVLKSVATRSAALATRLDAPASVNLELPVLAQP